MCCHEHILWSVNDRLTSVSNFSGIFFYDAKIFGFQCKPMFLKHFVNIPFNVIEFGLVFRMRFNYLLRTHLKCMNGFSEKVKNAFTASSSQLWQKMEIFISLAKFRSNFRVHVRNSNGNVACFEAITISMEKLSVFNFEKQQFQFHITAHLYARY